MRKTSDLIVISDLHLAAERNCGLFRADSELAEFLTWVYSEAKDSFLVLNGDIFDFLVGENGGEITSLKESSQKAIKIIENHPEVFDALAKITNSNRHQLFILGGNHDPEVALPEVQAVFEDRLRLNNFSPNIRWLVSGNALTVSVGKKCILIEHGDLFDDWNRIDYGKLQNSINYSSRLIENDSYNAPPGSYLVENLNPLRKKYPWIDLLKPITEATFPLAWTFARQELNIEQRRMLQKVLLNGISAGTNWLKRNLIMTLHSEMILGDTYHHADLTDEFSVWRNQEINNPGTSTKKDLRKLIKQLKTVSEQDSSFAIEVPERNKFKSDFLNKYIDSQQISAVVHGHTHSAKIYLVKDGKGLYLNSGTWGRLLCLPNSKDSVESWEDFLVELETGTDKGFLRPTFVRIKNDSQTDVVHAGLNEWNNPVVTLASWQIGSNSDTWKQEG
ncbi:MAG: metallophosphoesterase [Pyrinomonadaceae bacterium]|nr:metallophosphoesterase [Pyrinomonadaceae bacterium]